MSQLDKPSKPEDEYFAKQELERRKKWAEEQRAKMATAEKERLKEMHFMKCPKCGMDLATLEFHGIKIDKCASCGGSWFDAGEIEQLLQHEKGMFDKVMSIFR